MLEVRSYSHSLGRPGTISLCRKLDQHTIQRFVFTCSFLRDDSVWFTQDIVTMFVCDFWVHPSSPGLRRGLCFGDSCRILDRVVVLLFNFQQVVLMFPCSCFTVLPPGLLCSISVGALHPGKQWAHFGTFTASTVNKGIHTSTLCREVTRYDDNTGKRQPFTGNVRDRRNQERCSKFFPHYVENWGIASSSRPSFTVW